MYAVNLTDHRRASLVPAVDIKRDTISLVIAFCREVEEKGLSESEKQGILKLLEQFLFDSSS